MQGSDLANSETLDRILEILSWLVIVFGALWLVTGIAGFLHRRAYNLTPAESGGGKPITPDFLKVDRKKREEAIARGEAYAEVLEKRATPAEKAEFWSRAAAIITASFTLVGTVIGSLMKVESLETGVRQFSSVDAITSTIREHPLGISIAVLVIGANIIIFVKATKKTLARS